MIFQVPIGSLGAGASPRAALNTVPVSWQFENVIQTCVTPVVQVGVVNGCGLLCVLFRIGQVITWI